MMAGFSLVNVSGMSEPAKLLIEKISSAIGRHFDPSQKVRMAEAQAQADRILRVSEAGTDLEIAELRQRATDRFVNEEMTKQLNIESITQKALPHLADDASPDGMEDDWITNFFDKCRTASDDEMQQAWGRILAGEANNPGLFARKTINLMADLDKRDAELFTNLCRFTWVIGNQLQSLVFDTQHDIYNRYGINFGSLGDLETLGLIHFNVAGNFTLVHLPKTFRFYYCGRSAELTMPKESENEIRTGKVLLTRSGLEIASICRPSRVEGFFEYVYDRWAGESLVPPRNVQQDS